MMPSKKTVRLGQQGKAAGSLLPDGFAVCSFTLIRPLRPNERNFSADECWRKHYAGKYQGKRHTDQGKNKAVAGMLSFFVRALVGVRLVEQ